jgi:putative protein-disulfide isomerase
MLPELLRLESDFREKLTLKYCMGGLIKDWNDFNDPLNNVAHPSQMGPVWMDADIKTGLDIQYGLWVNDPPSSSYPACIAVKTAELQSDFAGKAYFRSITAAAMQQGENISKSEVLINTARSLASEYPDDFKLEAFLRDYNQESSRNAFRTDLKQVRFNQIGRFPSLTYAYQEKKLIITGYRSYQVLFNALSDIAPTLVNA